MEFIFGIVLIVTEFFALLFAANTFFNRRELGDFRLLLLMTAIVGATVFIETLTTAWPSILRTPISILFIFTTLCVSHEAAMIHKLFFSVAFYTALSALDYLVMSFCDLCFSISFAELLENEVLYLATAFIAKIILITAAYCLARFFCKPKKGSYVTASSVGLLLCIPCFSVLSVLVYVDAAVRTAAVSIWIFVVTLGLLGCNIVMFFLWDKLEAATRFQMDNLLLGQQVKHSMEQVRVLESAYTTQRRLTHDFHNHARTLQGLLDTHAYDEATAYVRQWTMHPISAVQAVHTNNHVANVVCNQKYEYAQQRGVSISFLVEDLSRFPLKDDVLAALLANALDNAIEAAADSTKKKILVKIRQCAGCSWIVSVKNTAKAVQIENNAIKTTKENTLQHGFGLQNMQQIVAQAHGKFSLSYVDGWFQFTATFPQTM